MSGNQFDKLHYLVVLAEERNITRAAERLYVSQPALTAYLNRLEKSLDVRLFDRTVSPIRLTAAGQHYISEMQKIEYEQNVMLEKTESAQRSPSFYSCPSSSSMCLSNLPERSCASSVL